MSDIRLYFDVDSMERAVIAGLRARGIDALTSQEAGTTNQSDEEQLRFARSEGRVLFTFNASDFCRIHTQWLASGNSHAGIILAPQQRYTIGERIRRLLKLVAAVSASEMHNRLEFLGDWD